MPDTSFKVYFGDHAAKPEELNRIEEIVVEQEVDTIWEGRLKLSMCLDDKGRWQHQADEFTQPFSRLRVELKIGDQPFAALIDGPIASYDAQLDSQPGRSTVTIVVRDDGVFLHREERNERYSPPKTDHDIVAQVFGRHTDVIGDTDIQSPPNDEPREAFQRTTDLVFLRELAHAHDFHAYVLPGKQRGKSLGCFRPYPNDTSTDHPPLVLLGSERNLISASFAEDSEGPERTRSRTLKFSDAKVRSFDASFKDVKLMRDLPPVPEDASAIRNVPPQEQDRDDPAARAHAQQSRRSYGVKMRAKIVPCYPAVLMPYMKVSMKAGNTGYSGDWIIGKVTHRITPSVYSQDFEAVSNSLSRADGGGGPPSGGPGLPISASASISIL